MGQPSTPPDEIREEIDQVQDQLGRRDLDAQERAELKRELADLRTEYREALTKIDSKLDKVLNTPIAPAPAAKPEPEPELEPEPTPAPKKRHSRWWGEIDE